MMAFAQGKQGHTYNITDQEMEEARGIFGKGKGRKRKRGVILKYLKNICLLASF